MPKDLEHGCAYHVQAHCFSYRMCCDNFLVWDFDTEKYDMWGLNNGVLITVIDNLKLLGVTLDSLTDPFGGVSQIFQCSSLYGLP